MGSTIYRGSYKPTQFILYIYHYNGTYIKICGEMRRLISSDVDFQEIELRTILGKPNPVSAPPIVPEPQLIIDNHVVPVVDPEDGNDENIEDEEELKMDLDEPEQIDEDIMEDDDLEGDIDTIVPEGVIEEGQVTKDITDIVPELHAKIVGKKKQYEL